MRVIGRRPRRRRRHRRPRRPDHAHRLVAARRHPGDHRTPRPRALPDPDAARRERRPSSRRSPPASPAPSAPWTPPPGRWASSPADRCTAATARSPAPPAPCCPLAGRSASVCSFSPSATSMGSFGLEPHRLQQRPGQRGQHPEAVVGQRRQLGLQPGLVVRRPHARVHQAARVDPHLLELVAHAVGVGSTNTANCPRCGKNSRSSLRRICSFSASASPAGVSSPRSISTSPSRRPGGQRRRHLGHQVRRAPGWPR